MEFFKNNFITTSIICIEERASSAENGTRTSLYLLAIYATI